MNVLILLPSAGTHTMALLEKLEPGSVYVVKISASNQIGDGPFSQAVELAPKRGNTHRSKNPRHSDRSPDTAGTRILGRSSFVIQPPKHSSFRTEPLGGAGQPKSASSAGVLTKTVHTPSLCTVIPCLSYTTLLLSRALSGAEFFYQIWIFRSRWI